MLRAATHSPAAESGERTIKKADLKAAASVLEAAGCTVQRGRLEEGVWDDRGGLYALPEWVVSDPSDVLEDEGGTGAVGVGAEHDGDGDVTEAEDELGADGEEGEFEGKEAEGASEMVVREKVGAADGAEVKGKGKEAVVLRDPVKIKVRLSDRGTDVVVVVDREESVRGVVRRILEEAEVSLWEDGVGVRWMLMEYSCRRRVKSGLCIWARCSRRMCRQPRRDGTLDMSLTRWCFSEAWLV